MSTTEHEVAAGFLVAARSIRGAGLWGDRKVFVAALFDALGASQVMTLAEFKGVLLSLRNAGLVDLARADLVGSMPAAMVARSEIQETMAFCSADTYHFVELP